MMKKKICYALFVSFLFVSNSIAQSSDEEEVEKKFFKKENLFTGGSIGAGFGQGAFSLGLGPFFGYSINKYVDVAAALNYNYVSQREPNADIKYRQSIIGPSAFVRVFPVKMIFLQAQYEYNFIKFKAISDGATFFEEKIKAKSMLLGAGYASGREGLGVTYFYFSVFLDVSKDPNSPYVDQFARKNAIIRSGINIPLFQGRRNR
jgi:hypothetical protein